MVCHQIMLEDTTMDLITAIVAVAGPPTGKIIYDVWQDLRGRRKGQMGIATNQWGVQSEIPNVSGVLSVTDSDFASAFDEQMPISLKGQFIATDDFVEFAELYLEEEEKWVIVLVVDQETGDVFTFTFDFDGYAIELWPGLYSIYAFIVDPILDDVLGLGYPLSEDSYDPNPVVASGQGQVEIDIILFGEDEI